MGMRFESFQMVASSEGVGQSWPGSVSTCRALGGRLPKLWEAVNASVIAGAPLPDLYWVGVQSLPPLQGTSASYLTDTGLAIAERGSAPPSSLTPPPCSSCSMCLAFSATDLSLVWRECSTTLPTVCSQDLNSSMLTLKPCPAGWSLVGGECLRREGRQLSFKASVAACNDASAQLYMPGLVPEVDRVLESDFLAPTALEPVPRLWSDAVAQGESLLSWTTGEVVSPLSPGITAAFGAVGLLVREVPPGTTGAEEAVSTAASSSVCSMPAHSWHEDYSIGICQRGWFPVLGSCVRFGREALTSADAWQVCRGMGGSGLFAPRSHLEVEVLGALLRSKSLNQSVSSELWLGVHERRGGHWVSLQNPQLNFSEALVQHSQSPASPQTSALPPTFGTKVQFRFQGFATALASSAEPCSSGCWPDAPLRRAATLDAASGFMRPRNASSKFSFVCEARPDLLCPAAWKFYSGQCFIAQQQAKLSDYFPPMSGIPGAPQQESYLHASVSVEDSTGPCEPASLPSTRHRRWASAWLPGPAGRPVLTATISARRASGFRVEANHSDWNDWFSNPAWHGSLWPSTGPDRALVPATSRKAVSAVSGEDALQLVQISDLPSYMSVLRLSAAVPQDVPGGPLHLSTPICEQGWVRVGGKCIVFAPILGAPAPSIEVAIAACAREGGDLFHAGGLYLPGLVAAWLVRWSAEGQQTGLRFHAPSGLLPLPLPPSPVAWIWAPEVGSLVGQRVPVQDAGGVIWHQHHPRQSHACRGLAADGSVHSLPCASNSSSPLWAVCTREALNPCPESWSLFKGRGEHLQPGCVKVLQEEYTQAEAQAACSAQLPGMGSDLFPLFIGAIPSSLKREAVAASTVPGGGMWVKGVIPGSPCFGQALHFDSTQGELGFLFKFCSSRAPALCFIHVPTAVEDELGPPVDLVAEAGEGHGDLQDCIACFPGTHSPPDPSMPPQPSPSVTPPSMTVSSSATAAQSPSASHSPSASMSSSVAPTSSPHATSTPSRTPSSSAFSSLSSISPTPTISLALLQTSSQVAGTPAPSQGSPPGHAPSMAASSSPSSTTSPSSTSSCSLTQPVISQLSSPSQAASRTPTASASFPSASASSAAPTPPTVVPPQPNSSSPAPFPFPSSQGSPSPHVVASASIAPTGTPSHSLPASPVSGLEAGISGTVRVFGELEVVVGGPSSLQSLWVQAFFAEAADLRWSSMLEERLHALRASSGRRGAKAEELLLDAVLSLTASRWDGMHVGVFAKAPLQGAVCQGSGGPACGAQVTFGLDLPVADETQDAAVHGARRRQLGLSPSEEDSAAVAASLLLLGLNATLSAPEPHRTLSSAIRHAFRAEGNLPSESQVSEDCVSLLPLAEASSGLCATPPTQVTVVWAGKEPRVIGAGAAATQVLSLHDRVHATSQSDGGSGTLPAYVVGLFIGLPAAIVLAAAVYAWRGLASGAGAAVLPAPPSPAILKSVAPSATSGPQLQAEAPFSKQAAGVSPFRFSSSEEPTGLGHSPLARAPASREPFVWDCANARSAVLSSSTDSQVFAEMWGRPGEHVENTDTGFLPVRLKQGGGCSPKPGGSSSLWHPSFQAPRQSTLPLHLAPGRAPLGQLCQPGTALVSSEGSTLYMPGTGQSCTDLESGTLVPVEDRPPRTLPQSGSSEECSSGHWWPQPTALLAQTPGRVRIAPGAKHADFDSFAQKQALLVDVEGRQQRARSRSARASALFRNSIGIHRKAFEVDGGSRTERATPQLPPGVHVSRRYLAKLARRRAAGDSSSGEDSWGSDGALSVRTVSGDSDLARELGISGDPGTLRPTPQLAELVRASLVGSPAEMKPEPALRTLHQAPPPSTTSSRPLDQMESASDSWQWQPSWAVATSRDGTDNLSFGWDDEMVGEAMLASASVGALAPSGVVRSGE